MSILNILRNVRHFYFNYHHSESTSLWIQSNFMRCLQFGIRQMICFLIVGFLCYGTELFHHLSLEYLACIISILCLQQTFGATLSCCYHIALVLTPLSIFLFIVQKLGLSYHDYLATELLLLFTSFCISFGCTQVQTKRFALLYNAIYFAANFSQSNIPSTFSFQLLAVYISGMFMALFASLIIFPLFATIDMENRFNYSLSKLQQMHVLIIEAFLSHDKMTANMLLSRSTTIESMVHKALLPIQTRIDEASFEPTRLLQRIYNRKHRHIIDLTLPEQEDFITSFMCHVCSLQMMVKQCLFNDYHLHYTHELQTSLLHLSSCQSIFISSWMSSSLITKDEFTHQIINLQEALKSLRSAFIAARLHRVKHVLEYATEIQSEDQLSHAFFLFQLGAIVRLLTQIDSSKQNLSTKSAKKNSITIKERLKQQCPRLLSSLKSMVIIGVGSIFVLVPSLANAFENGQWILATVCVIQGDTVGGAFITMKMRLMGTLLGAIWAYVTYLSVHDHVYQTLGMLSTWIFVFGYLKLLPNWGYTATVSAFTAVLVNLGRLPYGNALPAGNFALLRIEESFVGITIAAILTLLIFPIFAIDSLKDNIQTTLKTCQQSIISMHSIYDKLFHHNHSRESLVDIELEEQNMISFIDFQRSHFHRLINLQLTFIEHASLEPTLWWINNTFSTKRYNTLVQQQLNTFRMLYNIDTTLIQINEYSEKIEHLQLNAAGGNFLPNVHRELSDLSRQLNDCFHLWISYFSLTQTRFHRLFRQCMYSHTQLIENDLLKHQQCLIDLYQTISRLQVQHQEGINRLLEYYLTRLGEGDSYPTFVPYANSDEADSIFIAYHSMYYCTSQLAQTALTLGETIHTIFELETTHLYRPF